MKPSLNSTTIFKLFVLGIELCAAFEERENKQKNVKISINKLIVIFLFSQNCITQCL